METETLERILGQIHACCLRAATAPDAAALARLEARARALRADATPLVDAALAAGAEVGGAALRALAAADGALVMLMIRARAATPAARPDAAGRAAALLAVVATQLDAAAALAAERGDAAHASRCVAASGEAGRQATALLFGRDAEVRRGA